MSLKELVTFKVTKEMKEKMKKFDNINWSALLRGVIYRKIEEQEKLEQESKINFCSSCGKRLLSPEDKFCRICGQEVTH